MMTGAAYGTIFAITTRSVRRRLLVPAGALYGVVVFVVSAFIALPIASASSGSGNVISQMARIAGSNTHAVEHLIVAMTLGAVTNLTTRSAACAAANVRRTRVAA